MGSASQLVAPLQVFATRNRPVYVAVTSDRLWKSFCEALQLEHLLADPRFASNELRCANRADLIAVLEPCFLVADGNELVKRLIAKGVPCAPVQSIRDVVQDPHIVERQAVYERDYAGLGRLKFANNPLRLSDAPMAVRRDAPTLGQHTSEILTEAGYTSADIESLRARGVVTG